jgi:hypothetical protein
MAQADSHWHWPKRRAEGLGLFVKDLLMLNIGRVRKTVSKWSLWSNHSRAPIGYGSVEIRRLVKMG